MRLPFNIFKNKKEEKLEYYLALLLTDEKTSAVVLQESFGKLQVIGKHEELFSSSLEETDVDELINIIDKTISNAEEVLPPDIETHKTVFGLKDEWIDEKEKKIKKDYLAKLKKVCDSLDLSPIGFMVVTEAISNLLQKEEGAPLSAILAEIGKKKVTLTLFRGGKPTEKTDGPIEQSAQQTVDNLLKNFTATVLPARIILYDAKNSDKLSQSFIGHQWSKSLPFLHVPQILVLPEGTDAKAVFFGAGEQMGLEILGTDTKLEETDETKDLKDIEKKETSVSSVPFVSSESSHISSDNFGFVTDQDIVDIKPKQKEEESSPEEESFQQVKLDQEDSEENTEDNIMKEKKAKLALPNIFSFIPAISLPKIPLSFGHGKNKHLVFLVAVFVGFIILAGGITYFYFSNVKANIVLSVKPNMVDQLTTTTFSTTSSSDFSKNIIATKTIETTVKGELTIDTTGKKDVGNKAKGKVTIYNNGNDTVKLESGDNIKSSNNLVFVLDKDLTVASASGDVFSGTKPGTAEVNVTAKEIGTDYNLPSGTKFTVGNSSTLAAKNDGAFSGGSKKQVQVVSKNDIAKLRNDLPKNLEEKAHSEISNKVSGEEVALPLVLTAGLEHEKFDKNVDDEAKKIKLTADIKFSGMAYQKNDLIDYAKSILKKKYSENINFANDNIKTTVKDAKETKNKQIEATLAITAGLLPDINIDDIIKQAKEKSLKETKEMLSNQPQVMSTQINFSPNMLFLPNLFPKLPNQVSVEIKPE